MGLSYVSCCVEGFFFQGVLNIPISGESNNASTCKCKTIQMYGIFLRDFPLTMPCLGWEYNIMTPVFLVSL